MTLGKLVEICTENSVPEDVRLMSDSGWECSATDMDGIWYNERDNILCFTQGAEREPYGSRRTIDGHVICSDDWKDLRPKES